MEGRLVLILLSVPTALRLIHLLGKGEECQMTEDFLFHYLEQGVRKEGNLYYGNQMFFYFMGEALQSSPHLKKRFEALFVDKVQEQMGSSMTPIDLASRIIVSNEWGLADHMEIERLVYLQQGDGSWPVDMAYTGSRKNLFWGSPMISTAFALRALDHPNVQKIRQQHFSLPLFHQGFLLENGLLSYSSSFTAFDSAYETWVVTHAETPAALYGKFYDPDPNAFVNALTAQGQRDARAIGRRLKQEMGDRPIFIIHAQNTRTAQTASQLQEPLSQASIANVAWLNEIHCGEWLGQDSMQILDTHVAAAAMFHHSQCLVSPKNGESFLHFINRIYLGLKDLQNTHLRKDTVILLCTSRVNLVALKILFKKEVDFDAANNILWAQMAKTIRSGTVFRLK